MKYINYCLLLLLITSCTPLKIAPSIEDYKIIKGNKFKRKFVKDYTYIFNDPKPQDQFYNFINAKFNKGGINVAYNTEVIINGSKFYISFYEPGKSSVSLNFAPMLIDLALTAQNIDMPLEQYYSSKSDKWYIAFTVFDANFNDALNPNYINHIPVITYLSQLKEEYLITNNYAMLPFKK